MGARSEIQEKSFARLTIDQFLLLAHVVGLFPRHTNTATVDYSSTLAALFRHAPETNWSQLSESSSQKSRSSHVPSISISQQIKLLRSFFSEIKGIKGVFQLQELSSHLVFSWSSLGRHQYSTWILLELLLEVLVFGFMGPHV